MPSSELFEAQPQEYCDQVLAPTVTARLAVEAGVALGWERYVGPRGATLTRDRYGASAPYQVPAQKLEFTVDNVVTRARRLLR